MAAFPIGRNVTASVKDGVLTLTIDLTADTRPSKAGKSDVVATTGGNVIVPGALIDDRPLSLGLNAYAKKD